MTRQGVIYAATGERCVREALVSAASLRAVHPDLPVTIFTDQPALASAGPFEDVVPLPGGWGRSVPKLWAVRHSPYDRTLYLDSDTFVCGSVVELLELLDRFDVVGVPVPGRHTRIPSTLQAPVPHSFLEVNGGVLAFGRNGATTAFLERWAELYALERARLPSAWDQQALRLALWESDCRVYLTAPEYNVRFGMYPVSLAGPVRLLHGRHRDLAGLSRRVNRTSTARLWHPVLPHPAERLLKKAHRLAMVGPRSFVTRWRTHLRDRRARRQSPLE